MARLEPAGPDLATALATASATAAGQATDWVEMLGPFLMLATGGAGTVVLEMSVDGGATAIAAQLSTGQDNAWAVPVNQVVPYTPFERGLLFRLRVAAFTSGPIALRLSRGPVP